MPQLDTSAVLDVLANPDKYRRIQYVLSEDEYIRGARYMPPAIRAFKVGWFFSIALIVLALWCYSVNARPLMIGCLLLAAMYPVVLRLYLRRWFRDAYRSIKTHMDPSMDLSFGQGFLSQKGPGNYSYLTSLYALKKVNDFRLLGMSSQIYMIVPVRAFETPLALAEFDSIVTDLAHGRVL